MLCFNRKYSNIHLVAAFLSHSFSANAADKWLNLKSEIENRRINNIKLSQLLIKM